MTLKNFPWVYYMIICHVGPPWGHSGTHGGPKMVQNSTTRAQNHQNGSKCHCMTPNDPKHFKWVYKMIICHVGPSWALFRGPIMAQNITKMALHDQKWSLMTPNGSKTLLMGIIHDIMSCWTTLGPFQRPS